MKRFLAIAIAATVGLALAGAAEAATIVNQPSTTGGTATGTYFETNKGAVVTYTEGMSANGIQASRHNLGSMGPFISAGPETGGKSTSEICVFCHTPHHAVADTRPVTGSTGNYSPAPLWNRRSNATAFITYGSTIGGSNPTGATNGPGAVLGIKIGGVSLACLSCHDGVTTFDNLVNAPGEGGLQANYGDAGSAGWNFVDEGDATSVRRIQEDFINIGKGANNDPAVTGVADLSNDHPMSIWYSDGSTTSGTGDTVKRASLRSRSTRIASIDLRTGLFTSIMALSNNLGQNRWAVKGFISTSATIQDLLRGNKVECSSCHDPHFKNLSNIDLDMSVYLDNHDLQGNTKGQTDVRASGAGSYGSAGYVPKSDGLFLRRVGGNAGSGVCRTCHNK